MPGRRATPTPPPDPEPEPAAEDDLFGKDDPPPEPPINPAESSEGSGQVAGEAVTVDAIIPSAAQNKAAGKTAIARTGVQSALPGALIVIVGWWMALHHVDLDPGPGTDMPSVVTTAFTIVGTMLMSYLMNRGRLRGDQ